MTEVAVVAGKRAARTDTKARDFEVEMASIGVHSNEVNRTGDTKVELQGP